MNIFDYMDCEGCPHCVERAGRTGGDPDDCRPPEFVCNDGDFGGDYPCERMLARIEEGIDDAEFDTESSALMATPWSAYPYWQIFYDGRAPAGFGSLEEVCKAIFL
jgi:hypothetical protein